MMYIVLGVYAVMSVAIYYIFDKEEKRINKITEELKKLNETL